MSARERLDDLRFTAAEWRHRATAAWENWLTSWENRTLAQRTRSAAILLFAGGAVAAAWFIGRTDPVTFTVEMSADSPTTVSVAGSRIAWKCLSRTGIAKRWSTGPSKNP